LTDLAVEMQLLSGGCDTAQRDGTFGLQFTAAPRSVKGEFPSLRKKSLSVCGIFSMDYGLHVLVDRQMLQVDEMRYSADI